MARSPYTGNPADYSDPFARCPGCDGNEEVPCSCEEGCEWMIECPVCDSSGRLLRSALTDDERADLDSCQEECPPE